MEYLDTYDLVTTQKSKRMRSWYLYEQYKSLERNQLDAAQKLKERSCQDRILNQELSERKLRRKLFEQVEACKSDCGTEKDYTIDHDRPNMNVNGDFFETFCEYQQDVHIMEEDKHETDLLSQDGSQMENHYIEDFKSIEGINEEDSKADSVIRIHEDLLSYENFVDDELKDELELAKKNIAENINLQLETVKDNIECIEKYTKIYKDDIAVGENAKSDNDCISQEKSIKDSIERNVSKQNSLLAFWSMLVSFAYQVIQTNNGNCYYDYSVQLSAAVLACDILRKGIIKMCLILQPYVSPIKCMSDDEDEEAYTCTKKSLDETKCSKNVDCKPIQIIDSRNRCYNLDRLHSMQKSNKFSFEINGKKKRAASEPLRSLIRLTNANNLSTNYIPTDSAQTNSSGTIWPEEYSYSFCQCRCQKNLRDPIEKLTKYLEMMLSSNFKQ